MKEPEIGTERIAELLEGRIGEPERAELLARLARSEEDLWAFLETAAVLQEAEGDTSATPDSPPLANPARAAADAARPHAVPPSAARTRGWRWRPERWGALAAVVVAVVLVPVLWWPGGRGRTGDPGVPASLLAAEDAGLPAGWIDAPAWESSLGPGDPLPPLARAVRAGAVHTDLLVANRAGERDDIGQLRAQLGVLLAKEGGSALVAHAYDVAIGAGAEASTERFEAAGRELARQLGADPVRWGAWVEGARLAAARGDTAFFRADETRSWVRNADRLPGLPPQARDTARRVALLVSGEGQPNWAELQQQLRVLMNLAAS